MPDNAEVDPELVRQLDAARETNASVSAAVSIRRARGVAPDPAKIEEAVRAAVARAEQASTFPLSSIRVLPRMAVAYVAGPERVIRALLHQPEIAGAVAGGPTTPPADRPGSA